jgi:hypothetical protein
MTNSRTFARGSREWFLKKLHEQPEISNELLDSNIEPKQSHAKKTIPKQDHLMGKSN